MFAWHFGGGADGRIEEGKAEDGVDGVEQLDGGPLTYDVCTEGGGSKYG